MSDTISGITTVVSLGDDQEAGVRVRDAQAVSSLDRARLFVAGAGLSNSDIIRASTGEAAA